MAAATKHKVTQAFVDGERFENHFQYRGVTFRVDRSKRGYWGAYSALVNMDRVRTVTRAEMLARIDAALDKQEA